MAERGESHDPIKELAIFAALLIGLAIAWFVGGGYERAKNQGPFVKPLPPVDSGETYGANKKLPQKAATTTKGQIPSDIYIIH